VPVAVRNGKLVLEIPFQAEIELQPTDQPDKWAAKLHPSLVVEFKRDGDKPAPGLVLHQATVTHELARLKTDDGRPSVDALMKLRSKTQGTADLGKLGVVRIKGTMEQLPANKKGTIEFLMEGTTRYLLKVTFEGEPQRLAVDGDQVWIASGKEPAERIEGALAEQTRLSHPAFAAADWRTLFQDIQVLKRFEADKKSLILLWCVPKEAPARVLVVEAETGKLLEERHIEIVPGVGRIGRRVEYREYKEVGGVQLPSRVTQTYPNPLLGRFEHTFESFETKLEVPAGAFTLKPGQ